MAAISQRVLRAIALAWVCRKQTWRQNAPADRAALWDAFVQAGLTNCQAPPSSDDTRPIVDAALCFVSRTRSPLCMLPIEDVLGQEEQPNLPGTVSEHPNWRRRLHGEAGTLLDEPLPRQE